MKNAKTHLTVCCRSARFRTPWVRSARGRLSHREVGGRAWVADGLMTRLGSRDGSGGSPRVRRDARRRPMWRSISGGTWVSRALVLMLALVEIQIQADAAAPRKKRSEATPPKVEETVGDLAFVVQNGEIKVEGVGLVT